MKALKKMFGWIKLGSAKKNPAGNDVDAELCAETMEGITCHSVEPEEQVCKFCDTIIDEDGDCMCEDMHMIAICDHHNGRFIGLVEGITMRDRQEFIDLFDMHGIGYELSDWEEHDDLDDFVRKLNEDEDDDPEDVHTDLLTEEPE